MNGQERVQVDEGAAVYLGLVRTGVVKLGGVAQRLTVLHEKRAQRLLASGRLPEQPPVADLLDVTRLQVNLDRKAILELIQFRRIQRRLLVVFGKRLLRRADNPDLAVPNLLEILRQAVKVQDEVWSRTDVLADLINDKDDIWLAGVLAHNLDHLAHPLVLEAHEVAGLGGKGHRRRKELRVERVGQVRDETINDQRVVLDLRPGHARIGLNAVKKLRVAPIALEAALQRGHLQVARIPGPLQHLVVKHRRDILHRRPGEHLAGEIEEHHRSGVAAGDSGKDGPRLGRVQAILEVLEKAGAVHAHALVEGQTEILGEGTLARAVEARDPDAHLIAAAHIHCHLHPGEQALKLFLKVRGDDILGDLRPQTHLLRRAVGNHLLNRAVNVLGWVEKLLERRHIVV